MIVLFLYKTFMDSKKVVMTGMIIGSSLGGYLPVLWGGSLFSFTSILLTAVGGLLGIYLGFKISH
jgi:predicted esterase YcpF (UPF0227 family)